MNQLICGADGTRMECEENGVLYVDEEQGNFAKCDIYECPKCGSLMATGFSDWLSYDSGKLLLANYLEHGYSILYKGVGIVPPKQGAV